MKVSLFNITMPLPGTPMYREYKDRGLIFDWNHWNGNYLIWQHPTISKKEAMELLAEMRSEVNSPVYNPNIAGFWNKNKKMEIENVSYNF